MPRTLHLLGAAVAAAPLAALSLSLLTAPSPASATLTVRAPLSPVATIASARPALTASVAALAPSPALTRFSPAALAATSGLLVSPGLQLRLDARRRADDYLDLVATDQAFGPHRSLADTIAWMSRGVRATTQDPFGPPPLDRIRPKVKAA